MANDNSPDIVAAFIANIEAKIAALQAVLVSLKSASALGALGNAIDGIGSPQLGPLNGGEARHAIDLPEGAFHGKSVPACIELYLSSTPMKKRTNKEIAIALREGGVESNSNLENTVTGALFKLKSDSKVLRFKDGWGLSEWYPAHIRAINPAAAKRPKKKAKKGTKSKAEKSSADESTPPKGKATDLIIQLLQTKPEREYTLAEVAEHAGLGVKFARLTLGKMLKAGSVRMTAPGMYAIARPQLVAGAAV